MGRGEGRITLGRIACLLELGRGVGCVGRGVGCSASRLNGCWRECANQHISDLRDRSSSLRCIKDLVKALGAAGGIA